MQTGTISVQTENIFPIIKKFLYSDHEIFLRELVSNAVDACQKAKAMALAGEITLDVSSLRVEVAADKVAKTLTIRDNGVGMTAEEVDKYINQIAFSGAEEFVEKFKDAQIIGHFGLGFYSAFMVARQVDIHTLSHKKESKAVLWSCDGSPAFTMNDDQRDVPGTEIVLHLAEDSLEFLEDDKIQGILSKYCKFMPVPIQFGTKTEWLDDDNAEGTTEDHENPQKVDVENIINNPSPAWIKKPVDLKDEDYKAFYHELYPMTFDEPLFHIHINVDYPFNLTGILFFPKIKNNFEVQKNKIQLYCNQVFITDEVKNILPDFLTLLHGVVDSPDIPLNVSRSYLQEDSNVKKISAHISRKVGDKLQSMFNNERPDFESKWDDIGLFIQYGMLTDEKFYEKASSFAMYKSTDGKYFTLDELKERVKEVQKDKKGEIILLYTSDKDAQHGAIASALERGYLVLELNTPLTSHFLSHLEMKNTGVHFRRVDADIMEKLIEKETVEISALGEETRNQLKPKIEALVDTKLFQVSFENMGPGDSPFVVTQSEWMRRMKEQSAMGGGGFYGTLPESYNLVANANHPLFASLIADSAGEFILNEDKCRQAIDLALLAKGLLKGEDLTRFVKRSTELL